jgi:hypothetical protein
MRCLYCGKELALLKRWTGGGEFCSDAHRQRYQEEYNQLALNRLLQAKPPGDQVPVGEVKAVPAAVPAKPVGIGEGDRELSSYSASRAAVQPISHAVAEEPRTKQAYREIAPPAAARIVEPEPEPVILRVMQQEVPPAPEVIAPAGMAEYLVEMPQAAAVETAPISQPDLEFLIAATTALPSRAFEPLDSRQDLYQLETAGIVAFQPYNRASNYTANGTRERRLEVRDFVRTAPVVEINLSPAIETGLETSSESMDILIFPQPPQGLPALWQELPVGFSAPAAELGDLARLSFTTTGFSDQDESKEIVRASAVAVEDRPQLVERPQVAEQEQEDLPQIEETEPAPEVREEVAVASVEVEPEPVAEVASEPEPEPVIAQPVVEAVAEVPEPVEKIVEPEPVEPEPVALEAVAPEAVATPVPDAPTKPLPLVLHVAAPGKAKTVQVFASASSAVEAQVPRSTSLPMRPVMVFGPAPAAAVEKPAAKAVEKPIEKPVEKKVTERGKPVVASAPVRPDPRLAKLRGSNTENQQDKKSTAAEPVKETAPPVKQAANAAKAEAKQDKKPEVKEVKLKEEPKSVKAAEASMPAPLASPYPGTSDLGLPHLSLQSPQGFLGRLPMVAKIGIVVVLLAGLGTLIAFSSKTGGAAVAAGAGTLVAGSPLPIGDAGWITEWGADAGVRRTRQISILRSSQTLTDYRLEMQGQIESKAIGWVFRAADPKNFYVTKLEIVKPGLEPTVALVRFAVINGEEQAHAQLPLPMKVRRDTMYKIRFDAVGNHFSTYIQDVKVDDWTDDRVKTGGVGLYSERGEVMSLKGGMNVVPLMMRK